jgi:D-alanine transfer protein
MALGIGHAHHQELSILCELLAAKEYLNNSKICIIFSPSWFQDQAGTNPEAFIEFVRPNFLNKIANDSSIHKKYRHHIGRYIHRNSALFSVLSPSMKRLKDEYLEAREWISESYLSKKIMGNHKKLPTSYSVTTTKMSVPMPWKKDWDELSKNIQTSFMASVTNNKMWVNDTYYTEYLYQSNGEIKHGHPDYVDISNCEEFNDFNLLIDVLKEYNVNCSFVIQPLNPYFYNDLNNYNDLMTAVKNRLDKDHIPYLDLFITEKKDYKPGTLKDVMHLGDYGWMEINRFLYTTYYE